MIVVAVFLIVVFLVLLLLNVPIAVAIGMACFIALFANGGEPTHLIARRMVNGIDSFALLAIPLFIFSGMLMGRGGMARRLIDFAAAILGRLPGGLAYVNTLTCMMFGSISGSATAAVSSIGGFMIPEMCRKGYNREFSVAVTTTSATCGLIIPPSNIMIVYAVACGNVSIAALFMAGVAPGIFLGLCIMATCFFLTGSLPHALDESVPLRAVLTAARRAFWSLFLVVITIGGILGGIFTATEAAAIAVAYSFILAVVVYQEVPLRDIPAMLTQTAVTTSIVLFLIGVSTALSWILTMTDIPQYVGQGLLGVSENRIVVFLLINALLLVVGTFMDMTPAVLIFTPIFLPVARHFGMDDIHFGIMIIMNLCLGLCTPPVGSCLFIGCSVGETSIARVAPKMVPFFVAMLFALLVVTFWDALTLFLPRIMGMT